MFMDVGRIAGMINVLIGQHVDFPRMMLTGQYKGASAALPDKFAFVSVMLRYTDKNFCF